LAAFRKDLVNNKTSIRVKDFGAGSRVFSGPERKIRQIAKTAGISKKRANILYKTVSYFGPQKILEIGTSLGMATSVMALAAPESDIDTLEGCPATAGVAVAQFEKFGLKNIKVHVGEFDSTLPQLLMQNKYDLIFFDGNHQKDATLKYFELCHNATTEKSVFILDDIHWSPEMEAAWEQIKKHEKVSLTIDSYQWGLVFFHSGREKEHFRLRF
jgi:predicted O-methyltransferase YrrM